MQRDSRKCRLCSFREQTNLFIYFWDMQKYLHISPKWRQECLEPLWMCAVGESSGDYLSVHSWTQVWTTVLSIKEYPVLFHRKCISGEHWGSCHPGWLSVTRGWYLETGREEREEIKTIKGKYVRVTCIRCPRAIPEGLSGHRHPLALNISNRGYFKARPLCWKCRYCYRVLSESGILELWPRGQGGRLMVGVSDLWGWG